MTTKPKIDLVPTQVDQRGNVRHYEVVRTEPEEAPPMVVVSDAAGLPERIPRATAHTEGSYTDRANAFNRVTFSLSVVTGLGLVVAGLFVGGVTGAVLVAYFFGGFCAVWLIAYLLHTFVSPEGSQFIEVLQLWGYVRREQAERHAQYRHRYGYKQLSRPPRRPLWASVLLVVLLFVGMLSFLILIDILRNGGTL